MCWVGFGYAFSSRVIGRAIDCNECGGGACRVLVAVPGRGLYSLCKRCGFVEWEWAPGDSYEYLELIASRYSINVKTIEDILNQRI